MVPHGAGGMSAGRQQLKEVFQQHAVGGRTAAAVARKKGAVASRDGGMRVWMCMRTACMLRCVCMCVEM